MWKKYKALKLTLFLVSSVILKCLNKKLHAKKNISLHKNHSYADELDDLEIRASKV